MPPQSQPYVLAAVITAVPGLLAASSAWYQARRGRKENHSDNQGFAHRFDSMESLLARAMEHLARLDTRSEKAELAFQRMDLRFDGIEDKVERHLGWHRAEAEGDLSESLLKESTAHDRIHPRNHD
jgi:hypothetical protein